MADSTNRWTVNHWLTHPDNGNDDCTTGDDFDTLEQAKASDLFTKAPYSIQWIEIDGPMGSNHYEVIRNPNFSAKAVAFEDNLERSERAMQAGMAFGCKGYNEEMGWE